MSMHQIQKTLRSWYRKAATPMVGGSGYNTKTKAVRIFRGPRTDLPEVLIQFRSDIESLDIEETELSERSLALINKMTELQKLSLKAVNISNIDACGNLKKLTSLTLSRMPFNKLPAGDLLRNLTHLDISNTRISELPEAALENIQVLNISTTGITSLSVISGTCSSLTSLDISNTQINKLPECYLPVSLKSLIMSQCDVRELNPALLMLENLEFLNVRGSALNAFPEKVDGSTKTTKIKQLDLGHTKITRLPNWFHLLERLEYLGLEGCRLDDLGEQDARQINRWELNYFRERGSVTSDKKGVYINSLKIRDMDVRYLHQNDWRFLEEYYKENAKVPAHEVKLAFLGDKGAGKTVAITKLFDIEDMSGFFSTLKGLQISTENLRLLPVQRVGKSVSGDKKKLARDTRINVWKMSGESLCQNAHPLFMTHDSLYIVVLDAQKEDVLYQRALFWLRYIERVTPDSAVILLLTYAGEYKASPLLKEMLATELAYITIEGIFPVKISPEADDSDSMSEEICDVIERLTSTIANMPAYTKKVPASWKRVARHASLLLGSRTTISRQRFTALCEYYGVNEALRDNLVHWLSQTGTIYGNRQVSASAVSIAIDETPQAGSVEMIHSPLWLAKGIYTILEQAYEKGGAVKTEELFWALNEEVESSETLFYTKDNISLLVRVLEARGLAIQRGDELLFPFRKSIMSNDGKNRKKVVSQMIGKEQWFEEIISEGGTYHYTMSFPILTEDMLSALTSRIIANHIDLLLKHGVVSSWEYIEWGCEGIGICYPSSDSLPGGSILVTGIPGFPATLHIYASPYKRYPDSDPSRVVHSKYLVEYAGHVFTAFRQAIPPIEGYDELHKTEAFIEQRQGIYKADISMDDIIGYRKAGRKEFFCAKLGRSYTVDELYRFLPENC